MLDQALLATLGELADESVEQTGPTGDFIYVDISSIDRETKTISDPKPLTLSQAPSRAKQILRAGDVLVSMTRPNLNAVALVSEQLDGAIGSTGFHVLRSRWLNPRFLLAVVQTQSFIDAMSAVVQGALYPAVRPRDIAAYKFSFETPTQQTRIVAKLEELLSELDAGVADLKAAKEKLAQYRQSLLKAAVDGTLTAEWRKQNTPSETGAQLLQRILTERRARWEAKQLAKFKEQGKPPPKDWQKKYPEPVQPDTADLPELPEGWVCASVDQSGQVQLGRQRAPQFHTGPNMVPYLRVANVFEDRIDISDVMEMHFSKEDEETYKLSFGDVLLNEGQSLELVGRPAIYRGELARACFTNTLVRFSAESGVLPEYALAVFLHYMHSGRFRKIAKITTNIAHLGAGRFAELEFLIQQSDVVRAFLDDHLGLDPDEGIESVLFVLRQPPWKSKAADGDPRFWNARGVVRDFLSRLYDIALAPIDISRRVSTSIWNKETLQFKYLYVKDIAALRRLVGNQAPAQFFRDLESTYVSELIEEVRIRVRLKKNDGSVTFRELSEGEQQLLTVLGLLRFTAEDGAGLSSEHPVVSV